jgi:hypothetical protein
MPWQAAHRCREKNSTSTFQKNHQRGRCRVRGRAEHKLDWSAAPKKDLTGNLRILKVKNAKVGTGTLYFLRGSEGNMYVVSLPAEGGRSAAEYEKMSENRMMFALETITGEHEGKTYAFARIS